MRALLFVTVAACGAAAAVAPPCERAEPASYRTSALTRAHVFMMMRLHEVQQGAWMWSSHVADVDGDGQLDCWATYNEGGTALFVAWPSCTGDGTTLAYPRRPARLVVPDAIASPAWLQHVAKDLGDATAIACTTKLAAFCVSPGPEWRWVIDATYHKDGRSLLGSGELHWHPFGVGIDTVTRALITTANDHVVLVLDPGRERTVEEIECAGVQVGLYKGGVFARDMAHRQWAWLLRGLPAFAGFTPNYLECKAGLVIAHARHRGGDVVRIDPETGTWAFETP